MTTTTKTVNLIYSVEYAK